MEMYGIINNKCFPQDKLFSFIFFLSEPEYSAMLKYLHLPGAIGDQINPNLMIRVQS